MAGVSALRRDHSFRRLHARCLMGGAHVSLSARRTDLHYAMVFAGRFSLVSMALRGWPVDALRRAGAGSVASGGGLVVRKYSPFSLVRCDRARHGLLHDCQID